MNKPLTIEELKALEVGEWVYIKDLEFGNDFYAAVTDTYLGESAKYINIASAGWYQEFWFEAYGTKWLAYKNKEEAEGEYDIAKYKEFYEIVKSYYKDLDDLAKRIQDDIATGESHKPFQVEETDELALCYILDKVDEMEIDE